MTEHEQLASSSSSIALLSQFSSWQDKLTWLNGYDLWNLHPIPGLTPANETSSIRLSDGPHGVRKPLSDLSLQESFPATCFPSACATACSWNDQLLRTMGRALALESEYYDVQVLLGPGVNLKRHPTGGRNHEYFSEDPYLTGRLACAYIEGVQESGKVAACIKHFCLNNQESHRMVVNVLCDDRTMRELYLPAFEMTIKGKSSRQQPKTIMASYNRVMGKYACENSRLLTDILRDEWKFDGVVVSDWAAVSDRVEAIRAGMDLEMPGSKGAYDPEVLQAVQDGRLSPSHIDECAGRINRLIQEFQPKNNDHKEQASHVDTSKAQDMFERHDQLAREIAHECIVLLQNNDNLLPLDKSKTRNISVIGDFAKNSRYQGMGSAHVTPTKITSLYDALSDLYKGDHEEYSIFYAPGYDADEDDDEIHQRLVDEAVEVAAKGDVVLVCVGLPEIMESEGFDRPHIHMPEEHVRLVESICKVHQNVVVLLSNGGVVTIPNNLFPGPKAILDGFLLGQAGGGAMLDVLFGIASPSGRLPEAIPISIDDIPATRYFPGTRDLVQYREGLDVGYRYFDTNDIPVRFPFGHGLAYTSFAYENLQVAIHVDEDCKKNVTVSLIVRNTGQKCGKEVVQLYVRPINSMVYRPLHELKDFQKLEIEPGQSRAVEFELDIRSFAFFDTGSNEWTVESSSQFEIQVGSSSRDIRLSDTIRFKTGKKATTEARQSYPPKATQNGAPLSSIVGDDVFADRFGMLRYNVLQMIEEDNLTQSIQSCKPIHRNTLLKDAATVSLIARVMMKVIIHVASREVQDGPTRKRELKMITANVENLPLRNIVLFSQGKISFQFLDSLILLMNGNYSKGFRTILFSQKRQTDIQEDDPNY
ncbi:thermostable beta-glucosidase B [Nitzschia inconspicua]|uniref:beta-glucosidase n=1 Tax=Nitzschia inconspicua TaxID=303405 RepID=A0A9K3LEP9_9STRA|nr:thermostable beta-glucosidase B [Nitzschia inconspicua]